MPTASEHRMETPTEIEITQEMLEAGLDVVWSASEGNGPPPDLVVAQVREIYRAMAMAAIKQHA